MRKTTLTNFPMQAKTPLSVTESPHTVPEGGQSGGGPEEYLVGSVTPSTAGGPSSKPTVVEFSRKISSESADLDEKEFYLTPITGTPLPPTIREGQAVQQR